MKLIVGLGNPGEKYKNTPHNLGFLCLDTLLEKFEPIDKTFWEKDNKVETKALKIASQDVILAKPQTFMNLSGLAISHLLIKYQLKPEDLIVIHDDLDLPFGKIKIRFGGASAGHKGVESIIEKLSTDRFLRIRLGIGERSKTPDSKFLIPDSKSTKDYVLSNFKSQDIGKTRTMIKEVIKIIPLLLKHGLQKYMSKYNKTS